MYIQGGGTELENRKDKRVGGDEEAAPAVPVTSRPPGKRERTDVPRSFASMSQLDYLEKSTPQYATPQGMPLSPNVSTLQRIVTDLWFRYTFCYCVFLLLSAHW